MEARDRSIRDWLAAIRKKDLALPRFQRKESWDNSTREDFLTSVVRELPVGSTLLLKSKGDPHFESRYLTDNSKIKEDVYSVEHLLDGQQRLTTLWKTFTNSYDNRTYLLSLEKDEPEVIGKKRYTKEGKSKLYPLWVDDPEGCRDRNMYPLHIMNPDNDSSAQLRDWCEEATETIEEKEKLFDKLTPYERRIGRFNIPYLYLPPETEPHVAIDVFIKLNTSFVSLSTFDIVVAQTEEATGESLHKKLKELKNKCPQIAEYTDPEKYILRTEALLQDKMPSKKGYFSLDLQEMIEEWDRIVDATNNLINFLEQEKIYDEDRLPTDIILAPMAALFTTVPNNPDRRGNARRVIKKYMWRSFFTNRYERSTGSRTQEDYRILKEVIQEDSSEGEVPCFNESNHPIISKDELKQARWPKYKDRVARGMIILSFKEGARNFADDREINKNNIQDREYHHLYPKSYLKQNGYDESEAETALNCALINWKDNRSISSKSPLEYLIERSEADHLGEDQIRKRLNTHQIDYDDLSKENYERFIDNRAQMMLKLVKNVCNGRDYDSDYN